MAVSFAPAKPPGTLSGGTKLAASPVLLSSVSTGSYVQDTKSTNVMRDIKVAKLVLNICVGESGDRLSKAARVSVLDTSFAKASQPEIIGRRMIA